MREFKDKIRVGIVGMQAGPGWSNMAHIPSLSALPHFEVIAVCTRRPESAEQARAACEAKYGFSDSAALAASNEVDLVVVSVSAPSHYAAVMNALEAKKPVFCEWPFGSNLPHAEEMAARATREGVLNMVGLQGEAAPPVNYARSLIEDGYVGQVLSATIFAAYSYWGRTVSRAFAADIHHGAHLLAIPGGHGLDLLTYILGDFAEVSAVVSNQIKKALAEDTGEMVEMTCPDQFAMTGTLQSGVVVNAHMLGAVPKGGYFQLRINGVEGEMILEGNGMPEIAALTVQGSQGTNGTLQPLPVPEGFLHSPELPVGPAYNVGYAYANLAKALMKGGSASPDFAHGLKVKRLLDAIQTASDTGMRQLLT